MGISKVSLVAPAPLLHFNDSSIFDMQHVEYDPKISENVTKKAYVNSSIVPKQLFVNYCFGHPNSTVLLFPYSSSVQFINHDKNNTNAELRWSKSNLHKSHWLTWAPLDLPPLSSGLMGDIVATKDIAENEEIFLNYGEEWENAFTKHLNEWQQPFDASTYIDANKMNQNDPTSVLRTLSEQRDNPYPSNIQTGCYYKHEEDKETSLYENTVELDIHYDNQVSWLPKNNLLPCDIFERTVATTEDQTIMYYHVLLYPFHQSPSRLAYPIVVRNVPREQIAFIASPYTTNMYVKNAIRHAIGIPNDMFPEIWKNL